MSCARRAAKEGRVKGSKREAVDKQVKVKDERQKGELKLKCAACRLVLVSL